MATLPHQTPEARKAKQEARIAWQGVTQARCDGAPQWIIDLLERQARAASDRMHEVCGTYNPRTGQRMTAKGGK